MKIVWRWSTVKASEATVRQKMLEKSKKQSNPQPAVNTDLLRPRVIGFVVTTLRVE